MLKSAGMRELENTQQRGMTIFQTYSPKIPFYI